MSTTADADFERWEAFYDDDVHTGALMRRYREGVLLTRITFGLDDEQWYRAESRIEMDPDGSAWTSSHYRQEPGAVDVRLDRAASDAPADALPSYAEFLLVHRLVQGATGSIYFRRMADGDPDEAAAAAMVQTDGTTTITTPGGATHHVQVVTVRADDALANAHWVAAGEVLGSDWNGAESWLVEGPERALHGLPQPMAAFLRGGFDHTGN